MVIFASNNSLLRPPRKPDWSPTFFYDEHDEERKIYSFKKWSSRKYQDQFFYFNMITRHCYFANPWAGQDTNLTIYDNDLTNDYDSTATAVILAQYLNKICGIEQPTLTEIQKIFHICMNGINEQRKIPLLLSTLRESSWKSSTLPRNDPEQAAKIQADWVKKSVKE